DAGIRIETKKDTLARIEKIVNASDSKQVKERLQDLAQINNHLGEIKDVFHIFSAHFPLAAAVDREAPGGPVIWVANLQELLACDQQTGKVLERSEAWWNRA